VEVNISDENWDELCDISMTSFRSGMITVSPSIIILKFLKENYNDAHFKLRWG